MTAVLLHDIPGLQEMELQLLRVYWKEVLQECDDLSLISA